MTDPFQDASSLEARQSLAERMTSHFDIDTGAEKYQLEILRKAITRLLDAPTAREIAAEYLAESIPTTIHFRKPESTSSVPPDFLLLAVPRGYASWADNRLTISLSASYLTAHESFPTTDLPVVLGHELFGHGIWYARADRAQVRQGYHHHELNETNARLVGWLINLELNGPVDCGEPIRYLGNAEEYLAGLKLKLPYYALTFSSEEMLRPAEVLEMRAKRAREARTVLAKRLVGLPDRARMTEDCKDQVVTMGFKAHELCDSVQAQEMWIRNELTNLDAVVAELDTTIGRFHAESENESEKYLRWAAEHALFADLQHEVDKRSDQLRELLSSHIPTPTPEARDDLPRTRCP